MAEENFQAIQASSSKLFKAVILYLYKYGILCSYNLLAKFRDRYLPIKKICSIHPSLHSFTASVLEKFLRKRHGGDLLLQTGLSKRWEDFSPTLVPGSTVF
jgi:hypothetical protein